MWWPRELLTNPKSGLYCHHMNDERKKMRVCIAFLILVTLLALAVAGKASAATVLVYPYITNSHGGTANYTNLRSCVTQNGSTQCEDGIPKFSLVAGDYQVSANDPIGYTHSLGAGCSGTLAGSEDVQCDVNYSDGAPVQVFYAPAPVPATVPQVTQTQGITYTAGTTDSTTQAEQIAQLQAQIVELYKILIMLLQQKYGVSIQ